MKHDGRDQRKVLPMFFQADRKAKTIDMVTGEIVMEGDEIDAFMCDGPIKGTIKEILEEREPKGNYDNINPKPTFYKLQLY